MVKDLTVFKHENVDVVDSREVAKVIGKEHAHLLRDIKKYVEILTASNQSKFGLVESMEKSTESKIGFSDFFIPSTYLDSKGEPRPCYLLTKKGCDMVANKMTGEKGVLFTAAYVTAFEEMRQTIAANIPPQFESFSPSLKTLIQHELALQEQTRRLDTVEDKLTTIVATMVLDSPSDDKWQKTMNDRMNNLCAKHGLDYEATRHDLYKELESIAHVNLNKRLKNLRDRLQGEGATKTQINAKSRLSVIANDPKLRVAYEYLFNKLSTTYMVGEGAKA